MFLSYWNYHGCPKIFLPKGDEFFLNLLKCQFTMIDQNTKPLLHLDAFRNFLRLKQLISLVKLVSFMTKDFFIYTNFNVFRLKLHLFPKLKPPETHLILMIMKKKSWEYPLQKNALKNSVIFKIVPVIMTDPAYPKKRSFSKNKQTASKSTRTILWKVLFSKRRPPCRSFKFNIIVTLYFRHSVSHYFYILILKSREKSHSQVWVRGKNISRRKLFWWKQFYHGIFMW